MRNASLVTEGKGGCRPFTAEAVGASWPRVDASIPQRSVWFVGSNIVRGCHPRTMKGN